jgi:hypothetical protein
MEHEVAVDTLRKSRESQMQLDRAVKTLQVPQKSPTEEPYSLQKEPY